MSLLWKGLLEILIGLIGLFKPFLFVGGLVLAGAIIKRIAAARAARGERELDKTQ